MVALEGQCVVDGVTMRLFAENGKRPGWEPHSAARMPGTPQTDEEKVSRAEPEHHRVWPWLDWSMGQGAAKQLQGDHRIHYSQGIGSDGVPGRLMQAHEVRTVTPANGSGSVTHFFEQTSRLYAVIGNTWRQITPTLNAETCAARATDGVGNATTAGGYVSGVAAFTKASPPWYDTSSTKVYLGTSDDSDFAVSIAPNGAAAQDNATAWGYAVVSQGGDGQRLWASSCATDTGIVGVANIGQGQDPFTAALGTTPWSNRFPLGNRAAAVTGLAVLRDNVVVTTADGQIYAIPFNSGVYVPLEDPDGLIPPPITLSGPAVWNGILLVSTARGLKGWIEEGPGVGQWYALGPSALAGHDIPILDLPTAICKADPEWLYVSYYDQTNSWVWAGRRPRPGEGARTRMVWECIAYIASRKVTALHISHLESSANQPILLMGTATPDVSFVTLPRPGKNRANDSNCRSRTTSHFVYLPDADGGAPTTTHAATRLRLKTRNLTSSEKITSHVRVDRGGYQEQGEHVESPFSPLTLIAGLDGGEIGIALEFEGADSTIFKTVEGVEMDVIEVPEPSDWVLCTVYAAQNATSRNGQSVNGPTDTHEFLKLLQEQSARVEILDPYNTTYTARVDGIYGVHLLMLTQEPGRQPDAALRFRLNLYENMTPLEGWRWDDGSYSWDDTASPKYWDGTA